MKSFHFTGRGPAFGLLASLLLGIAATQIRAENAEDTKKEIAEIEKQIAELQKKLAELKNPPVPTSPGIVPDSAIKKMNWRCIGPSNMGGRITAIAVNEADPSTYYIATASGGLLKTTNNGTTFTHLFDREATVSIGDVAVSPSDPNIVWVGTGENNPRNSVSYGDGVYKSTNAGKSWENMGLKKSFQIGKIFIHPKDPNIVYVGALGRLYGPNEERGVFKTEDGGKNWKKVLYVDDKTGAIDLRMDPNEPNTLLVGMWERKRDGFDGYFGAQNTWPSPDQFGPETMYGPGGGLFRTTDGGKTWKKLTDAKLNNGLPTVKTGRIGIDYSRKTKGLVFAIIDTENIGKGRPQPYMGLSIDSEKGGGVKVEEAFEDGPAGKAGIKKGDVLTAVDGKKIADYDSLVAYIATKKPDEVVKFTVKRGDKELTVELKLALKPTEPGSRPYMLSREVGGQRANVVKDQGPDGFQTGGVFVSKDGGEKWERVNSLNPRPFYFSNIRVDPNDDKVLYVLGDMSLWHSTDGGIRFNGLSTRTIGVHPDQHALWIDPRDSRHMLIGCDGGFYVTYDRGTTWDHLNIQAIGQFYHVCVDNRKPYRVYGGLQDNGSWSGPSNTLRGGGPGNGPVNEDWVFLHDGDGFVCRVDPNDPEIVYTEHQNGSMSRHDFHTGEFRGIGRPANSGTLRWNWNTPFILSSHNTSIFYSGAQFLYRSIARGDNVKAISPELTRTKLGSITAIAESPRNADLLWVGTDDGNLWITRDGGAKWDNLLDKLKASGLPGPRWIASIEPSRVVDGRCYVCIDAHRSDDDKPYLFVTEDFGQTWKPLANNLPVIGSTRVLREDITNPNVLYCGTEFGIWISVNRGAGWARLNNNLPTVAVHEIAQPTTASEIVVATHGRSIWVLEVSALRQMSSHTEKAEKGDKTVDPLSGPVTLFTPATAVRWKLDGREFPYSKNVRKFYGTNPTPGAALEYLLTQQAKSASLKVVDVNGTVVRNFPATATEPGFHRLAWNLSTSANPRGVVPAGSYRVVLTVDGKEYGKALLVENDPKADPRAIITFDVKVPGEDEEEEEEREREEREEREKGEKKIVMNKMMGRD